MKNQFLQISTAGWLTLSCVWAVSSQAATPAKLLVVSVTKGFRHSSIPTAEKALAEVGQKSGVFTLDYARTDEELAQKMTAESLKQYDGTIFDEIYLLKNFHRDHVHVLLALDSHPNEKTPGFFPISWCKEFGKGRVFYTSLGHREDLWDPTWTDKNGKREDSKEVSEAYRAHILGGIKWALGLEKGDATPQSK